MKVNEIIMRERLCTFEVGVSFNEWLYILFYIMLGDDSPNGIDLVDLDTAKKYYENDLSPEEASKKFLVP